MSRSDLCNYHAGLNLTAVYSRREVIVILEFLIDCILDVASQRRVYLKTARVYHALGFFFADLILIHKIVNDYACHIISKVGVCGSLPFEAWR